MAARLKRKITIVPRPGFQARYQAYLALDPGIKAKMEKFVAAKTQTPPERLPKRMWDHLLEGPLSGIGECHLADDILLLYWHHGDVVEMLDVCDHHDLNGQIAKAAAAYVTRQKLKPKK